MNGQPLTTRTFSVPTSTTGRNVDITISEKAGVSADNLSLATWGSSYILANQLYRWAAHVKSIPPTVIGRELPTSAWSRPFILELGAGTGLVGLAAASVWRTNVVLTDLPSIMPGVSANILLNRDTMYKRNGLALGGTLDWSKPDHLLIRDFNTGEEVLHKADNSKVAIILAADTVYSEEQPELLQNTVAKWLMPGSVSRVMFTYALRGPYLEYIRELWKRFELIGLECIEEGQENGDASWDIDASFGTPYEWCVWRWKPERHDDPTGSNKSTQDTSG